MKEITEKKNSLVFFSALLLFDLAGGSNVNLLSRAVGDEHSVFGNLTSPFLNFLDDFFFYLENVKGNVSLACKNDTKRLINLAQSGNTEALKILDASGKPSSGILEGSVYFIGFYSECVQTEVTEDSLRAKYCLLHLNASSTSHQEVLPQASWLVLTHAKPPAIGICVPRQCTEEDVQYAAAASVSDNFQDVDAYVSMCHGDDTGFFKDSGAVIALVVFLLFIGIAAAATICDIIIEQRKSQEAKLTDETKKTISTTELFQKEEVVKRNPSFATTCLLSFSFKTNAQKIFSVGKGGDGIAALHGLKFLSMALIILGHTFSFASQNLYMRNGAAVAKAPKDFVSQIFANGTLAVDTFYFISGLLVTYVTLKTMTKLNGKLPLLYYYAHRYFRLTPLLFAVILFCAFLLRFVGSGPNWTTTIQDYNTWCKHNGWLNVLYLQNFINTENMCLGHSWYLATDMQMYLVTPLILIPMYKNIKYGAVSLCFFLLTSIITTATITAVNHYPAIPYINDAVPLEVMNAYAKNIYIKPYCRIGPYLVGMAVGWYLLNKKELELKKWTVWLLWCASITLGLCVIYLMWPANQGHLPTNAQAAAYSALARTVWGISLGWLMIACYYGYAGPVNSVLSWSPLVPLSRLTYCAYLIHPVVMNAHYGATQNEVDFSTINLLYLFLGNLCITYVLSTFLSLLFESPFVSLEKTLLTRKKT